MNGNCKQTQMDRGEWHHNHLVKEDQ